MDSYISNGPFVDLALATLGVIFLVAVTESFAKIIDDVIAWIPFIKAPGLHTLAVRMVLTGIATVICWQGHFGFFTHAGFEWRLGWENYLTTGALVSGGSPVISKALRLGNLMPSILGGMSSAFSGYGSNIDCLSDAPPSPDSPETNQEGEK